jgi:hypothetical protein
VISRDKTHQRQKQILPHFQQDTLQPTTTTLFTNMSSTQQITSLITGVVATGISLAVGYYIYRKLYPKNKCKVRHFNPFLFIESHSYRLFLLLEALDPGKVPNAN